MEDRRVRPNRLPFALATLVVLGALAWPSTAAQRVTGHVPESGTGGVVRPSGLEAMRMEARPPPPELKPGTNRHQSVPIPVALAALGLSFPWLVWRGFRQALTASRPWPLAIWPVLRPRAPPVLQLV
jgi:predicted metal-binding membrane protein